MVCFTFILILVSVLPYLSHGVKVDLKGSLRLGKEVVNALKEFVDKNRLSGRRSLGSVEVVTEDATEKDTIALIVHSAFICRQIEFCKGDLGRFVAQYLIALTKAIESVFAEFIDDVDKKHNENTLKPVIFEVQLKQLIRFVKRILNSVNQKINEANESYTWIDLIKRINAKFQDTALIFAAQRLEGNVQEITEVKAKLTQKLIVSTTYVELKFTKRLCAEYEICSKSHEVTKALNTFFVEMSTVSDNKAKEFIRHFYETLPSTNFYYRISDVSAHEFQSILHDMAYSNNVPTKNILMMVQKIVEVRLNAVEGDNKNVAASNENGRDVNLVHVILSDLDHFYSKQSKKDVFHGFLGDFFEWTKSGGKFRTQLRRVMKDLQNGLAFEADDLVLKLVNEVRVFMEITVDPDP